MTRRRNPLEKRERREKATTELRGILAAISADDRQEDDREVTPEEEREAEEVLAELSRFFR